MTAIVPGFFLFFGMCFEHTETKNLHCDSAAGRFKGCGGLKIEMQITLSHNLLLRPKFL